jgi:hypothetical protein
MLEGIAQVGLGPQQGAQQQQGEPMFGLEKVPYQPKGLKQMVVCNDVVAMALSNGHIIRLRLDAPDDLEGTSPSLPLSLLAASTCRARGQGGTLS